MPAPICFWLFWEERDRILSDQVQYNILKAALLKFLCVLHAIGFMKTKQETTLLTDIGQRPKQLRKWIGELSLFCLGFSVHFVQKFSIQAERSHTYWGLRVRLILLQIRSFYNSKLNLVLQRLFNLSSDFGVINRNLQRRTPYVVGLTVFRNPRIWI